MSTTHDLKTWPDYWLAMDVGVRTFEIRRDDRDFRTGDVLLLREWDPHTCEYTGRVLARRVTYVLRDAERFGVMEGFAALGLAPVVSESMVEEAAQAMSIDQWGDLDDDQRASLRVQAEAALAAALGVSS